MFCPKSGIPFKPGNLNFVQNRLKLLSLKNFTTLLSLWNTPTLLEGAHRRFDSATENSEIFHK